MTFDGQNKLIIMDNGEDFIDVRKMYYNWKVWLSNPQNLKYPLAMRYVGGDPIGDTKLGITYFLMNGWKIRPYESNHTLTVKGNLYSDDQSSPFTRTLGNYNVLIKSVVSNIVDIVPTTVYNNITETGTGTGSTTVIEDSDDGWTISG